MADFSDRLENALNEGRILILGGQVLIGFGFRSAFQEGFPKLPESQQQLWIWTLGIMLGALCLLILPVPFHYITESGRPTERLHALAQRTIEIALVPFALGMAVYMFIAAAKVGETGPAVGWATFTLLFGLFSWYGLPLLLRRRNKQQKHSHGGGGGMDLAERVKKVLIEARMVIPGVQALLGFQFTIVLMEAFDRLPQLWKNIHLMALALMAIAVSLLMAPAAYHRIVLGGEDSEDMVRVASRFVLASLLPLGAALAAEFGLVVWIVTDSDSVGFLAAGLVCAFLFSVWFGWTWWERHSASEARA